MCTCIEDLEKRLLEHVIETKAYKKPVKKVSMVGKAFSLGDKFKRIVNTDFEVSLEGQIKKPTVSIVNQYCQFCGEKYE